MTVNVDDFLLGALVGGAIIWALGTITLVAIRGAERSVPMAAGHWPHDDEDELDTELRNLTRDAA